MSYIEWLRTRVGQRKVLLTFATVVLRDARGRLLLQRRTDFNAWGLPGGVLELGEDIQTCARRELLEETGLTTGELELVGVYSEPQFDSVYPNGDQAQQYSICFLGQVSGGRLLADGLESRAVKFFKPDEIPLAEVLPWYQAMIGDALREDKPAFANPVSRPILTPQIEYMRSFLGKEPFIAACVAAAITAEDGSLLVIKHRHRGDWSIPSGYLQLGENAAHAARRVIYDETGLLVEPQRILDVYSPVETWQDSTGGEVQPVITLFGCQVTGGEFNASAGVSGKTAWISPGNLSALPAQPALLGLHQKLMHHLQ